MKATQRTALTGILAAVTLALSFLERLVCASLPLPPGVRLGLSNVIVTFACLFLGLPWALGIIAVKAGFIFLLNGAIAAFISLSGGVLSVLTVYLIHRLLKGKISCIGLSVLGAVAHNLGQLLAASATVGSVMYFVSAPVLLLSGVLFGVVTGMTMNAVFPALKKILPFLKDRDL